MEQNKIIKTQVCGSTASTNLLSTKLCRMGNQMKNLKALDFVKQFHLGWNLGNTLDAVSPEAGSNPLAHETAWGNPVTTKAMIDTIRQAGFDLLRVPVTWYTHMGSAPDYTIDPAWMARVKEIVDYGISEGMYVILNLHHENWHFPSKENLSSAKVILKALWTQIASAFADYDEHLIFESLNEPRMVETPLEWNGGTEEARMVINELNAEFVATIRSLGGSHLLRQLMVPGYAASANYPALEGFVLPQDEHIIASIHAYTPYEFALNTKGTAEFDSSKPEDQKDLLTLMNTLDERFLSKGHAVIIGEFGALNKHNLSARLDWARFYSSLTSVRNIPCVWWDNGEFESDGENFGLLDRKQNQLKYPELVEALLEGYKKQ